MRKFNEINLEGFSARVENCKLPSRGNSMKIDKSTDDDVDVSLMMNRRDDPAHPWRCNFY